MAKKPTKTVGDVLPKIDFFPDLPKEKLDVVIGNQYEITDAMIVRDFNSKFGQSSFALLLLTDLKDGHQFTTLCGGIVVVKKIQYLLDNKLMPILGTISYDKDYYDLN